MVKISNIWKIMTIDSIQCQERQNRVFIHKKDWKIKKNKDLKEIVLIDLHMFSHKIPIILMLDKP